MTNYLKFQSLEEEYWKILTKLNLTQYLNPINIQEERKKFFHNLKNYKKYNPYFNYKLIKYDYRLIYKTLSNLKNKFKLLKHPLSKVYYQKINFDLKIIELIDAREKGLDNYPTLLISLYDIPSLEFYQKVENIINSIDTDSLKKNIKNIKSQQVQEIFIQALNERSINNWTVLLDNIPSNMSVNTLNKIIKINSNELFSEEKIKSLIEHEIGTHVLRYENGSKQKYKIFRYGFPDYLQTEEGLAILSEYKNNLLSDNDMLVYCCRVIGSFHTYKNTFYDLFNIINQYINNLELSFTITTRIKRGLLDTSLYGGYTKDQVYLKGFFQLKNLNNQTLKKLYCGKIGIQDIEVVSLLDDISDNYTLPSWLT